MCCSASQGRALNRLFDGLFRRGSHDVIGKQGRCFKVACLISIFHDSIDRPELFPHHLRELFADAGFSLFPHHLIERSLSMVPAISETV